MKKITILVILLCLNSLLFSAKIYISPTAQYHEKLAAKEVQRYVYLTSETLLEIDQFSQTPEKNSIYICTQKNHPNLAADISNLEETQYLLKTINLNHTRVLVLAGSSPLDALYAAYHYAEQLGVRFYLHGDVIPDEKVEFFIPKLNIKQKPLFSIRGILPFHDFPEGPDWWQIDDYKAIFSQLTKMRMNFFGIHTYPEFGPPVERDPYLRGPEPSVWIGLKEDIKENGDVKFGYPTRHFSNLSGQWGYFPRRTSEFNFGAGDLFEHDVYAPKYMQNFAPWPITATEKSELFNQTGDMLNDVFSFAQQLGIKTCNGTETFLTLPDELTNHLNLLGKKTNTPETTLELYEGMFQWIKQNYPLDYYWFWTPEDWTWHGTPTNLVDSTKKDLEIALKAAKNVDAPFQLATCGWVLGPEQDRAMFDNFLPKDIPFSCINRNVGFEPIEPQFVQITDRETWAIPWMEDDPAMIIPQLWVGRMRRDAADALSYGCDGLIGIHWRTRILGPNVAALSQAAWEQKSWNKQIDQKMSHEQAVENFENPQRDLDSESFYKDWTTTQFGSNVSKELTKLFVNLDGGKLRKVGMPKDTNLPRPSDWYIGPGGLSRETLLWDKRKKDYDFISKMESLKPKIKGAGNNERFDYWLNQFKYLRAIGKLACEYSEFERIHSQIKDEPNVNELAEKQLLPIRIKMMETLQQIHTEFYKTINTPGALGNLANWQLHLYKFYVDVPGRKLEHLLGYNLPDKAMPSNQPCYSEKIINLTTVSALEKDQALNLKLIILGDEIESSTLYYKKFGANRFDKKSIDHLNNKVYKVKIKTNDSFEYHVHVKYQNGKELVWPATAPATNQTVIKL